MWTLRHLLVSPLTLPAMILAFLYYFTAWVFSKTGRTGTKIAYRMFVRRVWLFVFCDRLIYWADGKPKNSKLLVL